MKYFNNIIETIGNTPLIKLNSITKSIKSDVFVKVESFNPGNSVKDRMAIKMVEDAEKEGKLKPGGTIVEGTSGNTGMGLALAAIVKGYNLICVSNDMQSKEKFEVLKAMGAKVVVCPTDVDPLVQKFGIKQMEKLIILLLVLVLEGPYLVLENF